MDAQTHEKPIAPLAQILLLARKKIEDILQEFLSISPDVLILKLSLIFIVCFIKSRWFINYPLQALAIYMLVSDRLSASKFLWGILTVGIVSINMLEWSYIDNHKYLATYWILTCFLSLFSQNRIQHLQLNARWLIGLCFFFATFWKFLAGEYLDGTFFYQTLLTDRRFEILAGVVAHFTTDILPSNYDAMRKMLNAPLDYPSTQIIGHPQLKLLALTLSYLVITLEGSVALLFLLPQRLKITRWRHLLLAFFILSTYTLVSVPGFNYILVLLGYSQISPQDKKSKYLYLLVLLWTEVKKWPWQEYYMFLSGN